MAARPAAGRPAGRFGAVSTLAAAVAVGTALVFSGAGCASAEPAPSRPYWVDHPGEVEGGLAAVGMAPRSRRDCRDKAVAEARANLARAVHTRIKSVVETYNRSTEHRDVSVTDSRLETYARASLSGSSVKAIYEDDQMICVLVLVTDPGRVLSQCKQAIVDAGGEASGADTALASVRDSLEEKRRRLEETSP